MESRPLKSLVCRPDTSTFAPLALLPAHDNVLASKPSKKKTKKMTSAATRMSVGITNFQRMIDEDGVGLGVATEAPVGQVELIEAAGLNDLDDFPGQYFFAPARAVIDHAVFGQEIHRHQ